MRWLLLLLLWAMPAHAAEIRIVVPDSELRPFLSHLCAKLGCNDGDISEKGARQMADIAIKTLTLGRVPALSYLDAQLYLTYDDEPTAGLP